MGMGKIVDLGKCPILNIDEEFNKNFESIFENNSEEGHFYKPFHYEV